MIQVGRLSLPRSRSGGIDHYNPVLQWSWPSTSQWLVQGWRRHYAGGCMQIVASVTQCRRMQTLVRVKNPTTWLDLHAATTHNITSISGALS